MKLKSVVASLVVAGLISSPAFAAVKHAQKGHHHHKRCATNSRLVRSDCAAEEAIINQDNAKSPVSCFDWTNRIRLSGYLNVDARYGNRGPLGIVPIFSTDDAAHELNVNNANVFVDACISHCVTAHVGLAYVADSVNLFDTGLHTGYDVLSIAKGLRSDKGSVFAGGEVSVDEAFITIRDFCETPVFFRAGKMYVPFGVYRNPYPITYSLPQLLTQTRATTAELGFVCNSGLYGDVYILDGAASSSTWGVSRFNEFPFVTTGSGSYIPMTHISNYGATIGYMGCYSIGTSCTPRLNFDYHLNAGYIQDIRDVSYLADIQDFVNFVVDGPRAKDPRGFGMRQTDGLSLHADATTCAWHFSFDYVTALSNLIRDPVVINQNVTGTRIWAADLAGVYDSQLYGYNTAYAVSYQWSREAAGILPKWRLQGDVSAEIFCNTSLTLEYAYSKDYGIGEHGFVDFLNNAYTGVSRNILGTTGASNNQATLRLGVVF